jgi:hypothetical protein
MVSFALTAAALTAALGLGGTAQMAQNDMVQANKYLCRPTATATVSSAPICKGGGPLEAQPACFCEGIYSLRVEPACHRDGSPAMFSRGHRLTTRENDALVSCQDYARRRH